MGEKRCQYRSSATEARGDSQPRSGWGQWLENHSEEPSGMWEEEGIRGTGRSSVLAAGRRGTLPCGRRHPIRYADGAIPARPT